MISGINGKLHRWVEIGQLVEERKKGNLLGIERERAELRHPN